MRLPPMRLPWRPLGPASLSPVLVAAHRVLRVAGELAGRGCQVLGAHAINGEARIRIAPPPAGTLPTYGYLQPPPRSVRGPVVCVTRLDGVRVEWEARP